MDDLVTQKLRADLDEATKQHMPAMVVTTDYLRATLDRIQALETSLAEAEGRVIAEVVKWLRGQADAIDRLADEADGIHLHGGGPAIRTMAKARREAATALETGEWKK